MNTKVQLKASEWKLIQNGTSSEAGDSIIFATGCMLTLGITTVLDCIVAK